MPEYLHPGVYIEEIERGPRPIEGVATSTAAMLGACERGDTVPRLVTSTAEYASHFGGEFGADQFVPAAVRGFFENGGRRLFIVRIADEMDFERGLSALDSEECREVSLVYAPAVSGPAQVALLHHCERHRFRVAVIDVPSGGGRLTHDAREMLGDSSYAACYAPWLEVTDTAGARSLVPPGGHVLGIYARVDTERGVFKAPANEPLRGITGVEYPIDERGQEALAERGINAIREFPGRGIRVWGARTLSKNALWKYVNVRRLFIFLERSIYEGTQWVVFEPNDTRLWARVRDTIRMFLRGQWRTGALMGTKEEEAFFITCDETTMSQDDILDGRLIVEVGVAPVKPAEFVILRIFQNTAEAQR